MEIFQILEKGGALGGLALALAAVGYLFKKLLDGWESRATKAEKDAKDSADALTKEKDAHKQTAMQMMSLSQEVVRLLDRIERHFDGVQRDTPRRRRGAAFGGSPPSPPMGGGSQTSSEEDDRDAG